VIGDSNREQSTSGSLEPRFDPQALLHYARAVLERANVPPEDANTVAQCLIMADLRGVDSHGLIRLIVYIRRLHAQVVKATPAIQVNRPFPSVALVDGDNGLGPVVGLRAMETAMELAAANGIGLVGACRSNHFGVGAFYVDKAVRAGFLGCAISNAPPNMAPFGGRERFLGTNPFAIGIPAGDSAPLIFDASSSVAARGKIIAAALKKQPIPPGWALDPEGVPTTDANQALLGAVLPFGGAKGSAISFIIDILSGTLTGASYGRHLNTLENLKAEQNVGHVLVAIRRDVFLPAKNFGDRMDEILQMLLASPPAAGVERVFLPGELEMAAEVRNRKMGIPLNPEVVEDLVGLGSEIGLTFPPRLGDAPPVER
jgi:LDH2 family malate/lactate/ureidoglycolate dehydrogenase